MILNWISQHLSMGPTVPWRTANHNMKICDYEEPIPLGTNDEVLIVVFIGREFKPSLTIGLCLLI